MLEGLRSQRLQLTEEEAMALLSLCMMSEEQLDATSEQALKKLAAYCRKGKSHKSNHNGLAGSELSEAG